MSQKTRASKRASQIEPGDSIVVKGISVTVECVSESRGLFTIIYESGTMYCDSCDRILLGLSREGAVEEAMNIIRK